MTDLKVTQSVTEVVATLNPNLKVTQSVAEVVVYISTEANAPAELTSGTGVAYDATVNTTSGNLVRNFVVIIT